MTTSDDDRDPGILAAEDLIDGEENLVREERDPEASPADVQEQVTPVDPTEEGDEPPHLTNEVSEWDAIEQARVVELDEDYR
jgi:hypothetical protein